MRAAPPTAMPTVFEMREVLTALGARQITHQLHPVRESMSWVEGPRIDQFLAALFPHDHEHRQAPRPTYTPEQRVTMRAPGQLPTPDAWAFLLVRRFCPIRLSMAWHRLAAAALGTELLDEAAWDMIGPLQVTPLNAAPQDQGLALDVRQALWQDPRLRTLRPIIDAMAQPGHPGGRPALLRLEDAVAEIPPDGPTSWGTAADQRGLTTGLAHFAQDLDRLSPGAMTWVTIALQHPALADRWPTDVLGLLLRSKQREIRLGAIARLGEAAREIPPQQTPLAQAAGVPSALPPAAAAATPSSSPAARDDLREDASSRERLPHPRLAP